VPPHRSTAPALAFVVRHLPFSLCAAALVVLAAGHAETSAPVASAPADVVQHAGFSIAPGACEQGQAFCSIATARGWTPAEISVVSSALDEISASDVGKRIIQRARRNGFQTLRRFSRAAQPNGSGGYELAPTIAATTHADDQHAVRTIDLTDRFFERGTARDHYSGTPGYLLTTEILAHELVHALDLGQPYSGTEEFRRVARLGMPSNLRRDADRVGLEGETLNNAGQYEAGWEKGRTFAIIQLRGRLPSVQALDGFREAFAEFGAHLVVDPNARRRFEPRLLRYFDLVVFATP